MEAISSLPTLHWHPHPHHRPLPSHTTRTSVPTPLGDLELLISQLAHASPTAPALFFAHGGYGSACVWLDWLSYLHSTGYGGTMYAFSVRNHGASYGVEYARMVYGTNLEDVVSDLGSCLGFAVERERKAGREGEVVVVGHSSGGGLVQFALLNGIIKCRALCLVDSVPHFGALPVYANWARHDPWFLLRNIFHLQHPTSPLSSDRLVHGAFFGSSFPRSAIAEFRKWMPGYETMGWPMGMMGSFWAWCCGRPEWLDVEKIVRNVSGCQSSVRKDSICVMVGSQDVLMDLGMCKKQVAEYREVLVREQAEEKVKVVAADESIEGVRMESDAGVRLVMVDGAGHHLQNDVQRDKGAEALLKFVQQC
ncbi:uncharacterized protein LTR77_004745 [Saxophila tyrrhenica]|uniref:AB hydrolase-1 domain-containing protein n=1 Tax=Saxophila tyrrhenica TaxID=1690608 RepID=A0AAV9PE31_9PEZI|nr:hypothetical protein LTR77_004745 [Saxophila tyrrhenica]